MKKLKRAAFCVATIGAINLAALGYQAGKVWLATLASLYAVGMLYAAIVPNEED